MRSRLCCTNPDKRCTTMQRQLQMVRVDHVQLLGSTAHPEEASECYTAVWEQLAILARSTMYDPANLRMSGAYWPLTTACFLVSLLKHERHGCGCHWWLATRAISYVHLVEHLKFTRLTCWTCCAVCSCGCRSPVTDGLATAARTRATAGSSARCRSCSARKLLVYCLFRMVTAQAMK